MSVTHGYMYMFDQNVIGILIFELKYLQSIAILLFIYKNQFQRIIDLQVSKNLRISSQKHTLHIFNTSCGSPPMWRH